MAFKDMKDEEMFKKMYWKVLRDIVGYSEEELDEVEMTFIESRAALEPFKRKEAMENLRDITHEVIKEIKEYNTHLRPRKQLSNRTLNNTTTYSCDIWGKDSFVISNKKDGYKSVNPRDNKTNEYVDYVFCDFITAYNECLEEIAELEERERESYAHESG